MADVQPDAIIHAQALSDVDRCEFEPALAQALNVQTIQHVVAALRGLPTWLIYMSTDYVFDGVKAQPYDELDVPHPISVYGCSKLGGEATALRHPQAIVVRTSTLFGPGRMNFCDHLVSRLRQGQSVEAFRDQTTSPTYTEDLADGLRAVLEALPRKAVPGRMLHVSNRGGCTRLAFAQRVADALGASRESIRVMAMAEQHRPAPRPPSSALTSRYLTTLIGSPLRPWDEALTAYLRQYHCVN